MQPLIERSMTLLILGSRFGALAAQFEHPVHGKADGPTSENSSYVPKKNRPEGSGRCRVSRSC